ncbi:restriction endonuclease subunit S [Pseudodesulfovibrio thermohalotolerans]|uniref:restriction endonuclease subunit S n=1 Tax=Pseudodesulfovibrio thermohalotolerans TaxID=2880651 RepID=UPI0024420047|nr:restriction endonuclease subunit S [Pseudodesulfovibrio thermohalotolerans]WFS64351.1 restriction endonuclease subunit S [Pseudodesulfovibrio thermohalotolerans]
MKLAPYPEYKDSGVPWLGKIPAHWELHRGKWLFRKMERPVRSQDEVVTCFRDGTVTLRKNRRIRGFTESLKEIGYQGIRKGDLVIHQMDAFAGAVGVSDSDGKGTPVYSVCLPKRDLDTHYYAQLVREMSRSYFITSLAKGIRERSTDFRFDTFASLTLPVPLPEEQKAISRFMRNESAQINKFIRNKRRLIELLKEQKQNIINQAVTRGLDPKVKLKPSGVEWIGDIPEHWAEIPLKQIARADNSGSYGVEPELGEVVLPVATTAQIDKDGRFLVKKMPIRGFTEAEAKRYSCKPGEILVVKSSGSISNVITGKAGIFTEDTPDFAFSNFLMRLTAKHEKVLPLYLFYLLTSHLTRERVKRMVAGSTYPNLRVGEYLSSKLPLPEISEQSAICDFIRSETSVLDQAIDRTQREIELMREYRTRLISDVVTGQVDVRGVEVPEVAEEKLLALDEDTTDADDVIDDEGDMDETD